jgi:Protein of unknown function (DUF1573)
MNRQSCPGSSLRSPIEVSRTVRFLRFAYQRRAQQLLGLLLVLTAPLVLTGALLSSAGMFSAGRQVGELVVEPRYLAIGQVWTDERFSWRLPIQNTTDRPIDITAFRISCDCTRVDPPSMTIAPRGVSELIVSIDLTNKHLHNPTKLENPFSVTVTPISRSLWSRAPDWEIFGVAKDPFVCVPTELKVGDVPSGKILSPRKVRITSVVPLQRLAAAGRNGITARVDEENSDGLSYAVEVSSVLPLMPGILSEKVFFEGVDRHGKQLPKFALSINANVLFDVEIEPSAIYLGVQPVGTQCDAMLEVRSRTDSRFDLQPAKSETGLEVEFDGSSTDKVRTIRVHISPEKRGDQLISARIRTTNLSTGERAILTVPVFYYGTARISDNR